MREQLAVVGIMAVVLTGAGLAGVLRGWGEGLSGLLAFITQMALILLLGHALANTRPVRRLLGALAAVPRTAAQAVFVFLVAAAASLITWGLGLVVGALLVRDVAAAGDRRGLELSFPLLVAAGFAGFVVWHMGYSGSGPLTAATPGLLHRGGDRVHDPRLRDHVLGLEHHRSRRHRGGPGPHPVAHRPARRAARPPDGRGRARRLRADG